jgi:hypothetical protein
MAKKRFLLVAQPVIIFISLLLLFVISGEEQKVYASYSLGGAHLRLPSSSMLLLPKAPEPYSPSNGDSTMDRSPNLYWHDLAYAVSYHIQISLTSDFANLEQDNTTTASFYTATTLADGTYYWRVRAMNMEAVFSLWSEVWSFEIDNIPPDTPALLSPQSNTPINDTTPDFYWTAVDDAAYYDMQLTGGDIGVQRYGSSSPYLTYWEPLFNGTYFWQISAVDRAGNTSAWSETQQFTIVSLANDPPVRNYSVMPIQRVSWSPITWAVDYEIEVSTEPDFLEYNTWILASDESWVDIYVYRWGDFYWRVRARDANGIPGRWNPVHSFVSNVPATPTPSGPP